MGAWGVQLYASDTASDVKGDYIDKLKRGKTNEEVADEILKEFLGEVDDPEEDSEVWYALADTQWKYGRLLPYVKENALKFLERDDCMERWKEAGEEKYKARLKVLEDLKRQLLSPMLPEKKVSKYRLYQCEWKIGDIFAYKLTGDYAQEKGLKDKYIAFKKIGEDTWWPGHIIPTVFVYKWVGEGLPDISFLENLKMLPHSQPPERYKNLNEDPIVYNLDIISTSKKVIPENKLFSLGNSQRINIKPERVSLMHHYCEWNDLEEFVLENYLEWKHVEI